MAITTIEWTWRRLPDGAIIIGYTFNTWWGCCKVSQECKRCYAEGIAARYGHQVWGPATTTARRLFGEAHWREPLGWNAQAAREGHRRNVFCASMADVFEDHPDVGPARAQLWHLIEQTPWLNWLLLTKRPELIGRFSPCAPGTKCRRRDQRQPYMSNTRWCRHRQGARARHAADHHRQTETPGHS